MADVFNPNLLFLRDNLPYWRICALQGGTRSGKTYSALQYLIDLHEEYTGLTTSIVRKTYPSLRATAQRDYIDIMESAGLYNPKNHRKSPGANEYTQNGNVTEFFSIDNQQKIRGRKRDILYVNEANELTLEEWRQLLFRTTGRIIIDYNPSEADSFIYDHVLTRSDCKMLITTYLDNPHLTPEIINEIELLRHSDPDYWAVFGEGKRGRSSAQIWGHYKIIPPEEWPLFMRYRCYGLDFGHTAPTALIEYNWHDDSHYFRERLYERGLTNSGLIKRLEELNISRSDTLYCDAAEPDRIQELQEAGYEAVPALKNIKDGLDRIRSRPLFIHGDSRNMLREVKGYRWKKDEASGLYLDEPIGIEDHGMDGGRYAAYSFYKLQGGGGIEQS